MGKARVHFTTTAEQYVTVEIEDEELEGLSTSEIEQLYLDRAYDEMQPELCAQCSGWNRDFSIDLSEWEPVPDSPVEIEE